MKIVTALLVLVLFGSGFGMAQWKKGDERAADTPDRKSVNGFGGNLLIVKNPQAFIEEWQKPETPYIKQVSVVERGDLLGAFVLFAGCKPDARGVCNSEVDYAVYKPDGSLYAEQKAQPLWKEQAPPATYIQLSRAILGIRMEEKDPPGEYVVKAKVSDLNANITFELERRFFFGQTQGPIPPDFPTLQKISLEELQLKTEGHIKVWGLDKIERWDLSQGSGELVFTLPGGFKAVSPAQIIGTYNSQDHTWLWAWANSSIKKELQVDALTVREYGEKHHIDRLTTAKWVGTEEDAWAMVALAVKLCGEQGAYRGPAGTTYAFIAFGKVTLRKE